MEFDNILVIPYRNRRKQLDYFLKHSVPLIEKYMPKTRVIIVEQNQENLFNRGCLLNIGFTEYKNRTKYFLTHDIDINPTRLFLEKYNSQVPTNNVMGLFTSVHDTLGGIIKISSENIFKINGFPNDIWGWGGEDSALQHRAIFHHLKKTTFLVTNRTDKSRFLTRFNDVKDRIKVNHINNLKKYHYGFQKKNNQEKLELIKSSGLNNIKYKIKQRINLHPMVELIKVII